MLTVQQDWSEVRFRYRQITGSIAGTQLLNTVEEASSALTFPRVHSHKDVMQQIKRPDELPQDPHTCRMLC
jgi:hypothetical protein